MPISATAFILGFMNIAGIPPTIGFMSKFLVFSGTLGRGLNASLFELVVVLAALISTALTVGYAFWTIRRIFYGPIPEHLRDLEEAPTMMTIPMIILVVLSVVVGIFPNFILGPLLRTIQELIHV